MRIRYQNYNEFRELHYSVTNRMEEERLGRDYGQTGLSTDGFPWHITPERSAELRKIHATKTKEEK